MLPGVYIAQKKDGSLYYRSSVTFKNKHISLGSFPSEEQASLTYLQANKVLHDKSFNISNYYNKRAEKRKLILAFPKYVSLINFRDNNIYIKTPIYIHKNFFNYYFDVDDFFTFDTDDLFYFSSRTISRRGGHLFVADYGMQVNILSRYGIKNYAVENRDFRFVNGNPKDFRYSNIEIINRFNGVSRLEKQGLVQFETKIHVNNTLLVGRYDTEIEAAIAYNKAASILIRNGFDKEFQVNYIDIDELPSKQYQAIYKKLYISPTILNYKP